jgi:hypothetical protein
MAMNSSAALFIAMGPFPAAQFFSSDHAALADLLDAIVRACCLRLAGLSVIDIVSLGILCPVKLKCHGLRKSRILKCGVKRPQNCVGMSQQYTIRPTAEMNPTLIYKEDLRQPIMGRIEYAVR